MHPAADLGWLWGIMPPCPWDHGAPRPLLQILGTMDEELQIFRGQTEVEDDLCIIGPSQFKKAE